MGDKQVSRKRSLSRLDKMSSKARGTSAKKGGPPKSKKQVSEWKGRLPTGGRK